MQVYLKHKATSGLNSLTVCKMVSTFEKNNFESKSLL